jgi:hypothetical protein
MKHIPRSALAGAVVSVLLIAFGAITSAQGPNKCLAGKNTCASKEMQGKLKCHNKAETKGTVVDPACLQKADDKYTGGAVPTKGCFAKLEAKNDGPCVTTGDSSATSNKNDAFISDAVTTLDPGFPAPVTNKCSAGKKKCVLKEAAAIFKCHAKAVKAGAPALADPTCLQKAHDKFDGGAVPAKGCFAKLEAKGSCLTTGDTAALGAKVDAYTTDVLCGLGYTTLNCGPPPTPTLTPTPTPTVTPTCAPGPLFQGALVPTLGRFNYNAMIGLPAANAACSSNFPGSHPCTYFELQCAQIAGSLVGATDTSAAVVTSFWAIDPSAPPLTQCVDDVSSNLNWEYATAHTASRGQKVALNNPAGTLGPLQSGQACSLGGSKNWVGCCQ